MTEVSLNFSDPASVRESIVITATTLEPTIDRRNDEGLQPHLHPGRSNLPATQRWD